MATVLPLTRRPNPPSWSNMVSSAGSSSLGLYVLHRETATGAVGACAARPSGEPASQAPERALAVVDNHCLRVRRHCMGTASCLLICKLPVQTPHTEKPAAASRGFQGRASARVPGEITLRCTISRPGPGRNQFTLHITVYNGVVRGVLPQMAFTCRAGKLAAKVTFPMGGWIHCDCARGSTDIAASV